MSAPDYISTSEWDCSAYIEPTARSIYTNGTCADTPWDELGEDVRGEYLDLAVTVLAEILPGIVTDAVREFVKSRSISVEVLESLAHRKGQ